MVERVFNDDRRSPHNREQMAGDRSARKRLLIARASIPGIEKMQSIGLRENWQRRTRRNAIAPIRVAELWSAVRRLPGHAWHWDPWDLLSDRASTARPLPSAAPRPPAHNLRCREHLPSRRAANHATAAHVRRLP